MKIFNVNVSISHVKSVPSLHITQRTIAIEGCNHSVPWPGLEPGILQIRRNTNHSAEVSGESSVKFLMDVEVSFLGNKRPGYEANTSSLSNADVRDVWRYTSIVPHVLVA
jgi:hypothetical protein